MKKALIYKLCVSAIALSIGGAANAQINPQQLSVRLGVFVPTTRSLGANWFALGADYRIPRFQTATPTPAGATTSFLSFSADYYERGGRQAIPVVANYNVRAGELIFTAGAGIDFVRVVGDQAIGLAGQLGVTYDFPGAQNPLFVQGKYFLSSRESLRGFGLFAGVRF
jgi:hypothetical protein